MRLGFCPAPLATNGNQIGFFDSCPQDFRDSNRPGKGEFSRPAITQTAKFHFHGSFYSSWPFPCGPNRSACTIYQNQP